MGIFNKPSALAHISVLELTGPKGNLCGKILADLGADVTKIEPPDGDKSRKIGPFASRANQPDFSLYFSNYNTNKYSVMLDLESLKGANKFIDTLGRITRGAPKLGEHNNEIYTKLLGIPEVVVNQLVEKEVIA
ncbi:MAG: benzylsuccinate CoA-transferase BbsE subunit [Chloroflexi bacterium]|jgi:crotonobetainyl-CoA:carnitine CoA-transferase CaiB-like acyl-CoA transferase|nr:MAG: benzylsuccinate CoA-transferase BbsE subunit [Chloroflexota bacterium]